MLRLRRNANLVVFTGAIDRLPIETRHLAPDHAHRAPKSEDLAMDSYFRPCDDLETCPTNDVVPGFLG